MATDNENTLHESGIKKNKQSSHGKNTSLYDVLPSLSITKEQTGRRKSDEYLKLFQHLINQSNDAIFIVDPETAYYIDVNHKACKNLGYTYDELLTMRVMDIQEVLPDFESWREHVAEVCKEGSMVHEGLHKRKDGTKLPVEVSITYVTHEKIDYIIAFARDITERKKAEQTIRDQQNKIRSIIEHSNEVFYLHKANHKLTFISPQSELIFGYTPEEMMQRWTTLTTDNPMNNKGFELTERAIKTGMKQEPYLLEIRRKDGDIRVVEVDESPVKDEEGNVVSISGVIRDITERVKTEEDLKKSEARFRTLTASSPMGVFQADRSGGCVYVNDRFLELSGLPAGPVKVGDWVTALHPDDSEQAHKAWQKSVDRQEGFDMEYRFQHPDGKVIWVSGLAVPLLNDAGYHVGFIGTLSDITERKEDAEKAFRANQLASIGELAAGVAHEINNPINGIINYAQILENRSEPLSREWDICSRIIKEGDRIANIVSSLLSFARESGEEKTATNICDVLCSTLDLINTPLRKDNIRVDVRMSSKMSTVYVKQEQIRQVFLNIISNARYALNMAYPDSHENKILDIYCEEKNVSGHFLIQIVFRDRGTGMSKTTLKQVMNPFFTTKPVPEGTGLGLSISNSILTEHGGGMHIESEEGEFTKVILELPVIIKEH